MLFFKKCNFYNFKYHNFIAIYILHNALINSYMKMHVNNGDILLKDYILILFLAYNNNILLNIF